MKLILALIIGASMVSTSVFAMGKHPKVKEPDHAWLDHQGFRAVIASVLDKSFIYIESTENGLVFRACTEPEAVGAKGSRGTGKGKAKGEAVADSVTPPPSSDGIDDPSQCPTILNNEDIAIPAELFMKHSLGIGRILMTAVRVVVDGAVIVAADMGTGFSFAKTIPFSIAAVSAKSVTNIHSDNPIQSLTDLANAQNETKKLLKYGDMSADLHDGQIVTVLLVQRYSDIIDGVTQELMDIVKKKIRDDGDGSLGLKWELDYHQRINDQYNHPVVDTGKSDPKN